MKIIISIVVVMLYVVIGCFISKMIDEEYDDVYILFWPIIIACFIPIWIVMGILKGFGWFYKKLCKHKSTYAHIDQNIENRWASEKMLVKEWRHNSDDSPYDQLLKAKQAIERTRNINFKDMSEDVDCLVEEWAAKRKALDERMTMIKCKVNTTDTEEDGDHI